MADCYDSPNIEPGQTWSSYYANVECHRITDGTHADVTIYPYNSKPDRLIITEDLEYRYEKVERPFSIVFGTVIYGTTTNGVIKCRQCKIAAAPDQPPTDLLGMITYVKDKIIELAGSFTAMLLSLADIGTVINGARIRLDEVYNQISGLWTNLSRELDVFEIFVRDMLDVLEAGIVWEFNEFKKDVLDSIAKVKFPDLETAINEIKDRIDGLEERISSRIMTDLWDFIEGQIFDNED